MEEASYNVLSTTQGLLLGNGSNATLGNESSLPGYTFDDLIAEFRPANIIIERFVTPIWYILGFPGNILAFIVWIQPRMRPSSGCYLAALAMADLVFLLLQVMFELHTTWHIPVLNTPIICQGFPVIFMTSQYMSPLLVLGFTVERYISICHPFQRDKYCTTRRAITVITLLFVFIFMMNSIQGYFWVYIAEIDECTVREEVLQGGLSSIWQVWSMITELMIFGIVPISILVLNIMVIKEARRMNENEEKRMCLRKGHKSSSPSATTFMLLAVSFYLILTTLPVTICYVLQLSFSAGDENMSLEQIAEDSTWQRYFTFSTVKTVIEELGMSHFACNFYIYVATGKIFRQELTRLFYKAFCKKRAAQRPWDPEFQEFRSSLRTDHNTTTNGAVAHL